MSTESFHAQVCISEAISALNNDCFSPEYKIKRINRERFDYIDAFMDPQAADPAVLRQFDDMLKQLPEETKS
tara:strand:+ start:41 stop:256 length:216 start_codon:yes stop_codon:yes gene_type:complete